MTVSVVTCVYGFYGRFIPRWNQAIRNLNPAPTEIIVVSDHLYNIPNATTVVLPCEWKHPQAYYLNQAVNCAVTEWVWQVDIDDIAYPNALKGLSQVPADVWQMGFDRTDGERYVPPHLTNAEYLASDRNMYVGASAVRVESFRKVGGFPDVALQDWALWRRMARAGMTFQSSGRTHFRYEMHDDRRGAVELTAAHRPEHLAEMMEAELAAV